MRGGASLSRALGTGTPFRWTSPGPAALLGGRWRLWGRGEAARAPGGRPGRGRVRGASQGGPPTDRKTLNKTIASGCLPWSPIALRAGPFPATALRTPSFPSAPVGPAPGPWPSLCPSRPEAVPSSERPLILRLGGPSLVLHAPFRPFSCAFTSRSPRPNLAGLAARPAVNPARTGQPARGSPKPTAWPQSPGPLGRGGRAAGLVGASLPRGALFLPTPRGSCRARRGVQRGPGEDGAPGLGYRGMRRFTGDYRILNPCIEASLRWAWPWGRWNRPGRTR